MAQVWQDFSNWFWDERFWLPPNNTWKDLERDEVTWIPAASDLWVPFPLAIGMFIVRLIWERVIATPIGRAHKLRERPPTLPVPNEKLEVVFKKYKKIMPHHKVVESLAEEVGWSVRQVERWWWRRRCLGKPSEMQRFRETTWRFAFYLFSFYYGVWCLWDKPWLLDTKHCWYGYPRQHVSDEIYWYYMLELGFYWSLVISICVDVKRKDFTEMMIHHVATITLLTLSWSDNMVRVGTLVLIVHDAVDYWMEGAKLAKYLKYHKLCDVLFVIFTILWFVTRLVIFPVRVLNTSFFESREIIGPFVSHTLFNGLLFTLQILHFIWTYLILNVFKNSVLAGRQVEKDDRSETEPETGSEDDMICIGKDKRPEIVANGAHGDTSESNAYVNNNVDSKKSK